MDTQKSSDIKGPLLPDLEFRCAHCLEKLQPIDGRTMKEVKINDEMLKAVPELCYLGDMLSAGGGCKLAVVTLSKCSWKKFCQLLPLPIKCNLPVLTGGSIYSTGVRSVMLHAAEAWAMTVATLNRLQRNDGSVKFGVHFLSRMKAVPKRTKCI